MGYGNKNSPIIHLDNPDITELTTSLAEKANYNSPFFGLIAGLQDGYDDIAIGVLGDSTGNATDEWVYLLGNKIASLYPSFTVNSILWDDTSQEFLQQGLIQTGTTGRRYMQLATSGTIAAISDSGESITGDIDLRFNGLLPNWKGSAAQTLISRFGISGDRGFRFQVNTNGNLQFDWSADGVNTQTTVNSGVPVPFADGTEGWARVTMDVDDGAGNRVIKFYTSTDGVTWTQLGTTITTVGVTSIYYGAYPYEIGARTGTSEPILNGGKIYKVEIRNGINGYIVCPVLATLWFLGSGTGLATINGSPVLTLVNGSRSGAGIAYLGDATRVKKLTPRYGQAIVFLSDSHNEANTVGGNWYNLLLGWTTSIKQRIPYAPLVLLTQNPRYNSAGYIDQHAKRRRETMGWARANGYYFIDTYGAFLKDGRGSALINTDGIHPLQGDGSGQSVWLKAITDQMGITQ